MNEVFEPKTAAYDGILQKFYLGQITPGTRLVERDLADELGVSRIPVREALAKMVAQGVLIGGKRGQGVWTREYSPEDIRQLYEFRAVLEGGVLRTAARMATESDLTRIEMICDQMDSQARDIGRYDYSARAEPDYRFHEAMAQASHNERFVRAVKSLLVESYYVFYVLASQAMKSQLSSEQTDAQVRRLVMNHRELLDLVRRGEGQKAEMRIHVFIEGVSGWIVRWMVGDSFGGQRDTEETAEK